MGAHTKSADISPRRIMDAFRQLVQGLRVADRANEQATGLSGAQLFVLSKLAESSASISELARRTHTHQSSVSVVVDRLAETGLVGKKRSGQDRRRMELELTRAGKRRLELSPPLTQDRLLAAIAALPVRKRQELAASLEFVVETAGLHLPQPPLFFTADGKKAKRAKKMRTSETNDA